MAIEITIDENEWVEYIPEFRGNKDCPKKEIVSCEMKLISKADKDSVTDKIIGETRKGFRTKEGDKYSKAQLDMVNKHVKDIKNVAVTIAGKRQTITTMSQMYKIPHLSGLYDEIANALDASTRLEDFEIKN